MHEGERPLLGLEVLEVGQALQVFAQVGLAQVVLEAGPAERLRLLAAPERLERPETRLLPFARQPPVPGPVDRVERREGFLWAAGPQQPLSDLGGDARHAPGRNVLQGDERIDIALRIGNRRERPLYRPVPMALGDLVGIERPAAGPAHHLPVFLAGHWHRRPGQLLDARLQAIEAGRSKRRREYPDEAVELAVVVPGEGAERMLGQHLGVGRRPRGHDTEIAASGVELRHERAAVVIATVKHRTRQADELPEQVKRIRRIGRSHVLHDGLTLHLQIDAEVARLLPVKDRPRPTDGGESLADFARGFGRPRGAGELQPEAALDLRIAFGELDQESGKAVRSQRFKVLRGDGRLRCHEDQYRRRPAGIKPPDRAAMPAHGTDVSRKIVIS